MKRLRLVMMVVCYAIVGLLVLGPGMSTASAEEVPAATTKAVTASNEDNAEVLAVDQPTAGETVDSATSEHDAKAATQAAAPNETAPDEPSNSQTASSDNVQVLLPAADESDTPWGVTYTGHVQNIGWLPYVSDGQSAGTTGQSLRVEGLQIKLVPGTKALLGDIRYRMHVQNIGWQDWVTNGAEAGTTGQSLRVEALCVELTGEVAQAYDVYYRVHAQDIGWMGWAKNGASAGTAGKSLRLEAIQIRLVPKGEDAPSNNDAATDACFVGATPLMIQAHVQNVGWQKPVENGKVAGTTGQSLRVEALRVSLPGIDVPGDVRVQAHVQNVGWQDPVSSGRVAGTTGRGLRVEALQMTLTGEVADRYELYYRVHVSNLGWLGWAHQGEQAGTAGLSLRMEAVQAKLVPLGSPAPSDASSQPESFLSGSSLLTRAHVQDLGWLDGVSNGAVVGTTGQSRQLEALGISVSGSLGGTISYRAFLSGGSWQDWKANDEVAGTTGKSQGIEAVQIKLGGRLASVYDIWYRSHVDGVGWLDWAANGNTAGAAATGHSLQAIQVKLAPKTDGAPGPTNVPAIDKSYFEDPMTLKAQGYTSRTNWLILVDCTRNRMGIFRGSQGHWGVYEFDTVTTGAFSTPTIKGVYQINGRGSSFGGLHDGMPFTCYWWTRFYGPYLFHSVLYHAGTYNVMDGRLGINASEGCVRMPIEKAKWFHDTIPDGTTVVTY